MNGSHLLPENIPAHRVVNRKGMLTGKKHFGGPEVMQQLLESEGINVENDQIVQFKDRLWIPSEQLL